MMETLEKWWPAGAALVTTAIAYVVGQSRNSWQIAQLTRDVEEIKTRVHALETQGTAEAVTLGKIATLLETLAAEMKLLREEVKGKADK